MASFGSAPAAGYKFNTFQEIKSHSSILYNERLAILFYLLDMNSIQLNTSYQVQDVLRVKSILGQIYKNVRTLIRNNPTMRASLNLDTKDNGIYITDIAIGVIDTMIKWCETYGYSTGKVYIIVNKLNECEVMLKDVLQYYHYFIRPDFRQKPDIEIATESYKEIADKRTIEELREVAGKTNKIDFAGLGSSRIDIKSEIEYDKDIDGDGDDDDDEEVIENEYDNASSGQDL